MKSFLAIALVALVAGASAQATAPGPAEAASVAALVAATPDLSVLLQAVSAAGLADALGPDFKGTVFAPNNAAFLSALTALGLSPVEVLANPELLQMVLLLHVTPEYAPAESLEDGMMIPTLAGANLTVMLAGKNVEIEGPANSAMVVSANNYAGDAIVHIIDSVLLPADLSMAPAAAPTPAKAPAKAPAAKGTGAAADAAKAPTPAPATTTAQSTSGAERAAVPVLALFASIFALLF